MQEPTGVDNPYRLPDFPSSGGRTRLEKEVIFAFLCARKSSAYAMKEDAIETFFVIPNSDTKKFSYSLEPQNWTNVQGHVDEKYKK